MAGPIILQALRRGQLAEQHKIWVMQSMGKLCGSTFDYDLHHWGPDQSSNQRAIEQFEAWLDEPQADGG
jgi:hypothetical protein